jgi:predicted acyltransferase
MSPSSAASLPDLSKSPAGLTSATPASKPSARLVSLDALRGFDMFWILGGDALLYALARMWKVPPFTWLAIQFEHKDWAGLACYDLIFPLFVFIVGVSSVYSLTRLIEREGRSAAVERVLRRGALLLLLGVFYNGGITNPWPDVRLLGVLPRIALVYTAAGLLFCYLKPRTLVVATVALLVGYWALMTFVPIRDVQLEKTALAARLDTPKPTMERVHALFDATTARVSGKFEPGYNLSNHLDFEYLGGRKYDTYWDPEGLLSTLPAIATCLLGVFAGFLLRRSDLEPGQKLSRLLVAGVVALAVGWLWHLQFPVIKKIWTSSYVLVAGGWSLLLLGAFYYIVDVRQWRNWCRPFVWVGMNPITLYVISGILGYRKLAQRLAAGDVKAWLDAHLASGLGDVVIALTALALMFALARFLYRREIFLRF